MQRRSATSAMLATLTAAALFLFADGATLPIMLWDESRNIVNALEMRARGWSLVTTYGWTPDLWNTKPPLLIWAMWGSVGVFGASEWALRLPGMVATLAILWLVMRHAMRATGSPATGMLAGMLVAISPALFGEHGARTADYDTLLVAFTTAYCCLAFAALRRARPTPAIVVGAGLAVAGAVLSKSVAGLMPGVGLAAFALATGRWRRVVRDPRYLWALAAAAGPVALFAIAREAAGPGWLTASWQNDLGGRFGVSVVGVERPWDFYLHALAAGWFAAPLLLVAPPFAWRRLRARERLAALHAAAIALTVVGAASAAATKLYHYILPALPFMAVLAAIVARGLARQLVAEWRAGGQPVLVAVLAALLGYVAVTATVGAVVRRYVSPAVAEGARAGGYGALLVALSPRSVAVIEPGFVNDGRAGYAPVLRAYQLRAAARGQAVRRVATVPARGLVASCDPATTARLTDAGRVVARAQGCVAVAR